MNWGGDSTARELEETRRQVRALERKNDYAMRAGRVRNIRYSQSEADACPRREIEEMIATSAGGTAGNYIPEDVLTGTGTSATLSHTPTDPAVVQVWLNGQRLKRVTSAPTGTQFSVSGTTVTFGHSRTSSDYAVASYNTATGGIWVPEEVLGTGTSHTLAHTPITAASVQLFGNGKRLKRVASSPTGDTFSVSGDTITTAHSYDAGDSLVAAYLR